jgi:hypothetical protein
MLNARDANSSGQKRIIPETGGLILRGVLMSLPAGIYRFIRNSAALPALGTLGYNSVPGK